MPIYSGHRFSTYAQPTYWTEKRISLSGRLRFIEWCQCVLVYIYAITDHPYSEKHLAGLTSVPPSVQGLNQVVVCHVLLRDPNMHCNRSLQWITYHFWQVGGQNLTHYRNDNFSLILFVHNMRTHVIYSITSECFSKLHSLKSACTSIISIIVSRILMWNIHSNSPGSRH